MAIWALRQKLEQKRISGFAQTLKKAQALTGSAALSIETVPGKE